MRASETDPPGQVTAPDGLRLIVSGQVQAVGFRPFVYRLARQYRLAGWVRNRTGSVEIVVTGPGDDLERFKRDLVTESPPLARPEIDVFENFPVDARDAATPEFRILDSESGDAPRIFVPPDFFMCHDCEQELATPTDRRYRYPFINCTQCGPRYTLIRAMPYDRDNTTMASFELCDACQEEYSNPLNRRFHAEPLACAACGPRLAYIESDSPALRDDAAIVATVSALRAGKTVAVKGIGGYHLMCDAANETAIATLRARKPRPDKPLAVMFPSTGADGLDTLRCCAVVGDDAAALLCGAGRPIVLLPLRDAHELARNVAPGLAEIGAFLPYSPLHHLLLNDFGAPLVATSGNVTGEPVLTDNDEAGARLAGIADAFLHHDRPIERPADDPVYRKVAGLLRPIRIGRGCAPLELSLPRRLETPVLAVGGHLKNTVALAWNDRVVISPHVGDMDSPRSLRILCQVISDLQTFYGAPAQAIVCDAHPGYATSRWARTQPLPVSKVWHHHAHASALAAEDPAVEDWLVFTWDGVGLGEDGSLWGGESLYGRPGAWRRVASLKTFLLPGGDAAGREPWRSAAAVCWETGSTWPAKDEFPDAQLMHRAWMRGLNCHTTSAAGRLFDAAASLVLHHHQTSFEGQGPMQLEATAGDRGPLVPLPLAPDARGILRADWEPLLPMLTDATIPAAERAAGLHLSLAESIADVAEWVRQSRRIQRVGLTGGVFQNARLGAAAIDALAARGLEAVIPAVVPCNDAGLSYGQIIEYVSNNVA